MRSVVLALALAVGAAPVVAQAQASANVEQMRDQGVLYYKKKLYKQALNTLKKAYAAPGGKQDFRTVYYLAQTSYKMLLLEDAFARAKEAGALAANDKAKKSTQQLLDEMSALYGGVTFTKAKGETNNKGRIYFEAKTGIINPEKKKRFNAIRERFRSTDVTLPTTVYLPYGEYTANKVPFALVQGEEMPTLEIFLQIVVDETEESNLWWWVGIGSAVAVAAGVTAVLLLQDPGTEEIDRLNFTTDPRPGREQTMSMMKNLTLTAAFGLLIPALGQAEISTAKMIADRPAAHCQSPRWSPDGKFVAYDVFEPKKDLREIWIVPSDGRRSEMKEVSAGKASAASLMGGKKPPVVELAWAPDMKLLSKPYVFSSMGRRKNFDLFADGSWLTKENTGNDGQPAWSHDGRYIAYTSQRKDSGDIFIIDLAGDSTKHTRATLFANATEYNPRWAPKKNYLLFTRAIQGKKGQDIGVVADVSRPQDTTRMVTNWSGDEIRPSWSPDASKIAFYANKENKSDKEFDLWVIGINGEGAVKLASDIVVDDHQGPAWTPDGSTILFVKKDFKKDNPVMWVRADGSAKGELDTSTQLNSDLALWSGDGQQLFLAFKALGMRGSTDKTWERLYVVNFTMADLAAK